MKFNRIVDYIVFLLFALFAYFQFNDPDGWMWILVYGITALVALLYDLLPPILVRGLAFLFGIGLLSFIPNIIIWCKEGFPAIIGSIEANNPMIELVREAGGLLLVIITLIFYTKKADKK